MLSNDDMLPSRQTSEIIKTCHLGGGMLYVQGAIWGRGLVAFFSSKKATKPRPQMAPARRSQKLSKNENKSD